MHDYSKCHVIARVIPYSAAGVYAAWLDHETKTAIDLFLPYDPAKRGNLVVWDGCHSEAALGYYQGTKPPHTPAEVKAANLAVKRYSDWMQSIPVEDQQVVEARQRLPHDWREIAWSNT